MANLQALALDTTVPQIRAPGTGDGYSFNSGATALGSWTTTGLTLSTGNLTLAPGTANGVLYLDGSKVATTGSALRFDGTNLGIGTVAALPVAPLSIGDGSVLQFYGVLDAFPSATSDTAAVIGRTGGGGVAPFNNAGSLIYRPRVTTTAGRSSHIFYTGSPSAERLRIDESGNVGINTASPGARLQVSQNPSTAIGILQTGASTNTSLTFDTASLGLQNTNTTNNNYNTVAFINDEGTHSVGLHGIYTSHTAGLQSGAFAIATRNAGTYAERMRLDSSGNVGLGVTPSAWGSIVKAIEGGDSGDTGAIGFRTDLKGIELYTNNYWNGSNYIYKNTGPAQLHTQNQGASVWYQAASGTAGNTITFTQAMTLTAGGALLVGGTSTLGSATGVIGIGSSGMTLAKQTSNLANNGTLDITVGSSGGSGYMGFLTVSNINNANAGINTQTTYSAIGRGTTATFTSLASVNGPTSGASFTVTVPSNGVIRVTNTSGSATDVYIAFFGTSTG